MEACAAAEFKLHDMLRDGLCGPSFQPSVQSPSVPVIVRVRGIPTRQDRRDIRRRTGRSHTQPHQGRSNGRAVMDQLHRPRAATG